VQLGQIAGSPAATYAPSSGGPWPVTDMHSHAGRRGPWPDQYANLSGARRRFARAAESAAAAAVPRAGAWEQRGDHGPRHSWLPWV